MKRSPIGVAITRTIQPASWASDTNSPTPEAAGAAHTTTYSTPGDPLLVFITRERNPWYHWRVGGRQRLSQLTCRMRISSRAGLPWLLLMPFTAFLCRAVPGVAECNRTRLLLGARYT